uniref:cytochrome c oxidase subunit 3 n=1 Tax=Conidiobolus taihushanensis TaxID=2721185 RepID=UPI001D12B894|nr:cytochrome c oxidase subunit 3 [Conidiobolus taihushanensis]QZZ81388.1 cytochrome c oxidase subunit 3 [Conidiobolus taihushanensis]
MKQNLQAHPFHLVEPSPWPLTTSIGLGLTTIGGVIYFNGLGSLVLVIGLLVTVMTMGLWWRDCIREAGYQGYHTKKVRRGINIGFILFIVSEVFFFFSIFWAYFHSSLAPSVELGVMWPPLGIEPLNIWELPLLNTIILLSSGATVTTAHHGLITGNRKIVIISLFFTLVLAVLFLMFQGIEYYNAPFTFSDGVFGSTFFFSTGFHGIHVLVGTIFLAVAFNRVVNYELTDTHHEGFQSAILYWHFVDVVWLFLFIAVYYWGS